MDYHLSANIQNNLIKFSLLHHSIFFLLYCKKKHINILILYVVILVKFYFIFHSTKVYLINRKMYACDSFIPITISYKLKV